MRTVMLLNADFRVLAYIEWTRAVAMVVCDIAYALKSSPDEKVRSQYMSMNMPEIVVLKTWVNPGDKPQRGTRVTRRGVLQRDRHTCVYCGQFGDTIDHIMPQSRGGKNTWENLVASCAMCNQRKADKTPEEAGMEMLWYPSDNDANVLDRAQKEVWKILENLD